MAADISEIRTILGIIGNVISLCLFLSPVPTMFKIWKAKSVQSYFPDPYVITVANCAMWVFYAMPFVHPGDILVITINGAGLVIELIYISIFFNFSNWPRRRKILNYLAIELIGIIIIVSVSMTVIDSITKRSMMVGIVCVILTVAMYFSPLTIMHQVITTKSVKYMPFTLSVMNLANGCIWFTYAFIQLDLYIMIPNGFGILSGIGQIMLYVFYYGSTNWDEDSPRGADVALPVRATDVALPVRATDVALPVRAADVTLPVRATDGATDGATDVVLLVRVTNGATDVALPVRAADGASDVALLVKVVDGTTDVALPVVAADVALPVKAADVPLPVRATDN